MEISLQIKQIKHLKQYTLSEIIPGVDSRLRLKLKIQEYQKVELPNLQGSTNVHSTNHTKIVSARYFSSRDTTPCQPFWSYTSSHQPTYNHPYVTPHKQYTIYSLRVLLYSLDKLKKKKLFCNHQYFSFISVGLISPAKLCTRGMVT